MRGPRGTLKRFPASGVTSVTSSTFDLDDVNTPLPAYSCVPNNRACTVIVFWTNFRPIRTLFRPIRLLIWELNLSAIEACCRFDARQTWLNAHIRARGREEGSLKLNLSNYTQYNITTMESIVLLVWTCFAMIPFIILKSHISLEKLIDVEISPIDVENPPLLWTARGDSPIRIISLPDPCSCNHCPKTHVCLKKHPF